MAKTGPVILLILAVCMIPSAYVGISELQGLHEQRRQIETLTAAAADALRSGDTVAAVIALRRAQRYSPADPDIERRLLLAECRLSVESPASITEAGAVALMVRLQVAGLDAGTDSKVAIALGQLQLFRGETEAGHQAFVKAATLHPDSPLAHAALGRSYLFRKSYDKAAGSLEQATRLAPKTAEYRETLGRALAAQQKWGGAVEAFAQATELNDSGMNRLRLGEAQLKLGNYEAAIASLGRALAVLTDEGKVARTRAALGFAYHKADRLAESAVELQKAARVLLDPSVYFNLGTVRHALGQHRLAMLAFQQGLKYDPGNAGAHLQLIRSLLALGQKGPALEIRKRLLRLADGRAELGSLVDAANRILGIP